MASSLKKQLAVFHRLSLDVNRPRSLLGDADRTLDSVQRAAQGALSELCTLDPQLSSFEARLFAQSSLSPPREQLSPGANEELGAQLSLLLLRLSPFFLLRETQLVLEFLVRRYGVHHYNVAEVMQMMLPYHESEPFAAFLSILTLGQSIWSCLSTHRAKKAPVTRQFLVEQCLRERALLSFIGALPAQYHAQSIAHTVLYSFWTSILTALAGKAEPALLVEPLVGALHDRAHPSFQCAAYVVVAQLAQQRGLSERFQRSLLRGLAKHVQPTNASTALACIAVFVQAQRVSVVPEKVYAHLQRLPDVILHARQLKERHFPRLETGGESAPGSGSSGSFAAAFLSELTVRLGAPPLYRAHAHAFRDLPEAPEALASALDAAEARLSGDGAFEQVAGRLLRALSESQDPPADRYERVEAFVPLLSYLLDTLSEASLAATHLALLRALPCPPLRALPATLSLPALLAALGRAARDEASFRALLFRATTTRRVAWVLACVLHMEPSAFAPAESLALLQLLLSGLSLPEQLTGPLAAPRAPLQPETVEERLSLLLECLRRVLSTPFEAKAFGLLLTFPSLVFSALEAHVWGFVRSGVTPFQTLSWQVLQKSTIAKPQIHIRALSLLLRAVRETTSRQSMLLLLPTVLLSASSAHRSVREAALAIAEHWGSPDAFSVSSAAHLDLPAAPKANGPERAVFETALAFVRALSGQRQELAVSAHALSALLPSAGPGLVELLFASLLDPEESSLAARDIQGNLLKCGSLWSLLAPLPLPESLTARFLARLREVVEESATQVPTQFHSWIFQEGVRRLRALLPANAVAFDLFLDSLRPPSVAAPIYRYTLLSQSLPLVTSEFFDSLSGAQKARLFHRLVDLLVRGEQAAQVQVQLQALSLDLDLVLQDWKGFVSSFDLAQVSVVSVYSEMVRYHPQIHEHFPFLYPIFEYYDRLLGCPLTEPSVVFGLQSILEAILSYASQLMQSGSASATPSNSPPARKRRRPSLHAQGPEAAFNLRVLIEGLRTIDFPQPRNTILLILGSLVRAGNRSISVELIEILRSLLPQLLNRETDVYYVMILQLVQMVASVATAEHLALPFLMLFIESYPQILEAKKLWFFRSLVVALGEGQLHWLMLLLGAVHGGLETTMFCQSLLNQFPVSVQLSSISHLLDSLYTLQEQKELPAELPTGAVLAGKLSCVEFVSSQLLFVSEQLNSDQFIRTIVSEDNRKLQPAFLKICEIVFLFLHLCSASASASLSSPAAAPEGSDSSGARVAWERCLESCYDVLDTVKEFLDIPSFIVILNVLLTHENNSVRKRALIFFNAKIESEKNALTKNEKMLLLDMLPSLLSMASDASNLLNQQTAILSIHVLADHMAGLFQDKFVPVFDPVLALLGPLLPLEARSLPLVGSCFLLLATLARSLGVMVFPSLPRFLPVLLETLQAFASSASVESLRSEAHALLAQSIFSSFATLLPLFPSFLEPYLEPVLAVSLHPLFLQSGQKALSDSNKHVLSLFASTVPIQSLLPCVERVARGLSHPQSLVSLLRMLGCAVPLLTREGVENSYRDVFQFLFGLMEYRTRDHAAAAVEDRQVALVEDAVVKAFMELVLTVSETQLKPLFLEVTEWAKDGDHFSEERLPIYLQLVQALTTRLRGIFVPYFGFFLDPLLRLFSGYRLRIRQPEYYALVQSALKCLYYCCLYDSEGFVSDSVFHSVRKPLLESLDVTRTSGGDAGYLELVREGISPCLIQLVRAVNHDEAWKPLHHELLLKTRSSKDLVKLCSVRIVTECFRKMGEEYLPLLPETIPYLAELLGEGDPEIEQASADLKQCLENLSGENISELLVR